MTNSQQLRENLLQTDEEFRQLAKQHHQLDTRLSELSHQLYRTGNEELEKATLKKRKLQLKDRMEDIVRRSEPAGMSSPRLQPHARG
jgi:uncharacterized protein YdcH (DUF465 family)